MRFNHMLAFAQILTFAVTPSLCRGKINLEPIGF